jgi:uncharacterized protein
VPISMYQVSVPVCLRFLTALSAILDKAATHAREQGMSEAELLEARLAPDMFPLARQIQIATDHAKGMAARLAGREVPKFEDAEKSFEELKERIGRVMDFISSVEVGEIDGSEERVITIELRTRTLTLPGQQYLLHFALPNFMFHVTTAYGILRHRGVPLGKMDFMGA